MSDWPSHDAGEPRRSVNFHAEAIITMIDLEAIFIRLLSWKSAAYSRGKGERAIYRRPLICAKDTL
jgi:hypothetical protein